MMWRAALAGSLIVAASVAAQSPRSRNAGDWISYGGTNWSQKYSPLDQIDRDNFSSLAVAWTWTSPDFELVKRIGATISPPLSATGLKATPLVVDGTMYMSTGLGQIAAIDPATGATKWLYDPESYKDGGPASVVGPWQTRGVAYWTDGRNDDRVLMGTHRRLPARAQREDREADRVASASTARPISIRRSRARSESTVKHVERRAALPLAELAAGRRPRHGRSSVRRCRIARRFKDWPPGHVQAFDVRTGKLKWVFHVIPERRRVRRRHLEGWLEQLHRQRQRLVDDERRRRARPGVSADYDADERLLGRIPQGRQPLCREHRRGERRDRQARVALPDRASRRVGLRLSGSADACSTSPSTARRIKAIAQVSKQGFTYVFDRVTGKPVWPIEERPVPPSDIPGEELSPTQPFPTRPPAFEYQGVTEDLLIDFTPELRDEARMIAKRYRLRPALHAADVVQGRRDPRHAAAARRQRRRELERLRRRSGNRVSLCAVAQRR